MLAWQVSAFPQSCDWATCNRMCAKANHKIPHPLWNAKWICLWCVYRSRLILSVCYYFFLWPILIMQDLRNTQQWNMKREDQQDATLRCLLLTSVSTRFGHHYAHLQENKDPVTAFGVLFWFCWMWFLAVVGRWVVGCEHCSHPTAFGVLFFVCSARILQRSAPQPLPTTSSRTSAVHHMQ